MNIFELVVEIFMVGKYPKELGTFANFQAYVSIFARFPFVVLSRNCCKKFPRI